MGLNSVTQTVLIATLVTAVSFLGTILFKKWRKVKIPSSWEQVGNVTKIHLYPLKSGHRIELERAEITDICMRQTKEDGKVLQLRDRGLVVYGAKDYELRTARTYPKMVFIDVTVHDENHFAIDAPTMKTLYVKIPNRNENQVINIKWFDNEKIEGIDCGDEAATWFSRYMMEKESGVRLAFNDANKRRDITKAQAKLLDYYKNLGNDSTGLFTDLTSLSLITQPSVSDLNTRTGDTLITVENFRHNIIVDGPNMQPYEEDNWDWIKVGDDVVLRNVKDCTRCMLTTIDPAKGVRNTNREPLKSLEKYRKHPGPEKSPRLGLNLDVRRTGFIKIGDPIYVSRKEDEQ